MNIKFCGAAKGVTGSCHLISSKNNNILLDCGQFQGGKAQDALNYEPFLFQPEKIDFLVVSHAHIDHCGRIPLLVKRGFRGKIYCSDATAALLPLMLRDSAHIHEKEAEWKNNKNIRAGRDLVEPLYTAADVEEALKYIQPILYNELVEINKDVKLVFNDAGHILGSAIIELWIQESEKVFKIVFTGDLGVKGRPILKDPTTIKKADFVIMESTYGDRLHKVNSSSIQDLVDIILKTAKRGGTVVIPSFAVGRTQELIYLLARYREKNNENKKQLENINVYIDSPMAKMATEIFKENPQVFDETMKKTILDGIDPLDFPNLKFVKTTEESKQLNSDTTPKVIISASGMCEAGRIRHHLKHNLWDKNASVVFVGYQAEGSLGRAILEGKKDVILFGDHVQVNAQIHNLEGFSAHADKEGLFSWISSFKTPPQKVFLVHGEQKAKEALSYRIKQELGYQPIEVTEVSKYELDKENVINEKEMAIDEITNGESVLDIRNRIANVRGDLESLLYSTNLAFGENLDAEKINKINNVILSLEKEAMNLGQNLNQVSKK